MLSSEIIKGFSEFKRLEAQADAKALGHAYLFVSEDEILRREFAISLAKKILGGASQIDANAHPDFKQILNDKLINVASISDVVSDVYFAPIEADNRVYFIDDFSLANEEAQNKLLKTIEEPPKSAIILLGASAEAPILATILSRVNKVCLQRVSDEDICKFLEAGGVSAENAQVISQMAGGNLTKAQNLVDKKEYIALYDLAFKLFALKSSKDILAFESSLNAQKFPLNLFFDLTISVARDIMMMVSGANKLIVNRTRIDKIRALSAEFSKLSIAKIIDCILSFRKDYLANANAQGVVCEFLFKFIEVKVTCKK